MAPPELAADAPVLDVVQPLRIGTGPVFRYELDLARTHGIECGFGDCLAAAGTSIWQRVGCQVDKPLVGQHRLDHRVGAIAYRHLQLVRFDLDQETVTLEVFHHGLARVVAIQPAIRFRRVVAHMRIERHDDDHVEVVPLGHLVIVEVVCAGDLHAAGAELGLDIGIGNNRNTPIAQRQVDETTHQMLVTLVVRMHGQRAIGQHGLRAGGGDGHAVEAIDRTIAEGVADVPHRTIALDVVHLQIGHRRAQHRVPVHQPVTAIDQPRAIPLDEHLAYGCRQALVHGEALARPVGCRADPAHLVGDGGAGFLLPFPHAFDERLATQVVACLVFDGELVLDDLLRGDARVIGAHLPQRIHAAHALVAHQHVHHGLLERMAHVQCAGDIWRRQQDAIRLAPAFIVMARRLERTAGFPARVPLGLDLGGFETLFHGDSQWRTVSGAQMGNGRNPIVRGRDRAAKAFIMVIAVRSRLQ